MPLFDGRSATVGSLRHSWARKYGRPRGPTNRADGWLAAFQEVKTGLSPDATSGPEGHVKQQAAIRPQQALSYLTDAIQRRTSDKLSEAVSVAARSRHSLRKLAEVHDPVPGSQYVGRVA